MKAGSERVVVDNNALISRLLLPESVPGRAVRKVVDSGRLLVSEATLAELVDVLARPKFDRYVTIEDRREFIRLLGRVAELVPVTYVVHVCRDPDDNRVLEVAVNGDADTIVSGDRDLLVLSPFQGIPVLTPSGYLARK